MSRKNIVINGKKYATDEVRYFCWGNEPDYMVTAWTRAADRSVVTLGYIPRVDAWSKKLILDCPYN
ncbi:MAG: hypothetical protein LBC99_01965 [Spirochaetota bacterium]|jgi:hypothetical protein|nr:hypothetical protein [Spirochaetota bacterium]